MQSQDITKKLRKSILIVDDNPQNLQVLGKMLQENYYDVEFSTSGLSALEWLKERPFDLVMLDINMPGMSGFEVCKEIRKIPEYNKMPIIFLSAVSDRESILRGFELGAQDYVTKPFDVRELLIRVKTHLALKESLENLEELNKLLDEKVKERTLQLKEANEKLEAAYKKLAEIDDAKTEFLNIISHEIRTPLNGIIGIIELLKGPIYAKEIGEYIEMLDESVKRLEGFATDALLVTNLNLRKRTLKKEEIALSEIFREIVTLKKDEINAKRLKLNISEKPEGIKVFCDKELVKKCILNILDNSIRFSPLDGTIKLNVYSEDGIIICEITDEGDGFEDKMLKTGLELFTKGSEYKDLNVGFGLPVARMIMDAHGGELRISNISGGGAMVKLIFKKE